MQRLNLRIIGIEEEEIQVEGRENTPTKSWESINGNKTLPDSTVPVVYRLQAFVNPHLIIQVYML